MTMDELLAGIAARMGVSEHTFDTLDNLGLEQLKADGYNATEGTLNLSDGYNCPECKNKGFISKPRLDERTGLYSETLYPCKCDRIRRGIRRLQRSGLKDVVKKYRFDTYAALEPWQAAILKKAQDFTRDDGHRWFFMGGQSGCGKTHICTAIAVHYIRQARDVRYMVWRDEARRLKSLVNEPEAYTKSIQDLKQADVLYIDDLFKVGRGADGRLLPTGPDINLAFEIINSRYNRQDGITIISSEYTINKLLEIDEAVAGRIAEMSGDGGYCINVGKAPEKNYRTKGIIEL